MTFTLWSLPTKLNAKIPVIPHMWANVRNLMRRKCGGDAGTRGRGDAEARGRGDAERRGRGDAERRGRGDAEGGCGGLGNPDNDFD